MSKLKQGVIQQRFAQLREGDYFLHDGVAYLKVLPYESARQRGVNAISQPSSGDEVGRRWFQPSELVTRLESKGGTS